MNRNEIQAILTLLEDPDNQIYDSVSKSLFEKGVNVIPYLEKAWEVTASPLTQDRLENIIHKIQQNHVHQRLLQWVKSGAVDLLEGAYIISKHQYPEINFEDIQNELKKIQHDVELLIRDTMSALEKVRILNHVMFDIHLFAGNSVNYYAPQNSYINQLLLLKKGNAISLGLLYAALSQRLGLPVFGVNLPKNFILAYRDEFHELLNDDGNTDDILFYINPFNKGAILGRKEIDHFLQQQNITPADSFYATCSNLEIIQRLILNLIYSYEKLDNRDKINDLKDLLKISKLL